MRDPNQIPIGALSLQPETHGLGGTFFSRKGISNCSLVSRDAPQTSDKSWEDSPAERKRRGTRMECLEQRDCGGGRGDDERTHMWDELSAADGCGPRTPRPSQHWGSQDALGRRGI